MMDYLSDLEVKENATKPKQLKNLVGQNIKDLYYQYMLKASETRKNLLKISKELEEKCDVQCIIPPLKGFERTIEKLEKEYQGDLGLMTDIVRGSIAAHTMDELRKSTMLFKKHMDVLYTKNRFKEPAPSGYRDFVIVFRDPANNFFGELQLHLYHILKVKEREHEDYKLIRAMEGLAKMEQRNLAVHEQEKINSLKAQSKKDYKEAFDKYVKGEICDTSFLKKLI